MPSAPISFPTPRGTKPGPFSGEGRNRTPRQPPRRRRRTQNGLEKSGNRIQRHLQPSEAPPSPPRGTKPPPPEEGGDDRPATDTAGGGNGLRRAPTMRHASGPGFRASAGYPRPSASPGKRPSKTICRKKPFRICGSENRSGRATRTTRSAARNGRLPASHPAAAAIPQEKASRKNGTGNAPASECHEPEPPCPGRSPGAACGLGTPAESAAAERYRFGV